MRNYFSRRLNGPVAGRRQRRPRSRLRGCLVWVLVVVIVLGVLSLLFGGFRIGTKAGGAGAPRTQLTVLVWQPASGLTLAAGRLPLAAGPLTLPDR